jgi:hypothetical protein
MNEAKIGFELRKIQVPLSDILPVRQLNDPAKTVLRYKAILVSIKAVGLIEPLMVYPQKNAPGKYLLLDGHLRRFALQELGYTTADCIIAADDECFTYNARVSRIAPIQEHRMILKAVNLGVKPEQIGAALNIPLRVVKAYMNLLVGIHPKAVDLLKDKNISHQSIRLLRRVDGARQVEIAELMVGANNYANSYAQALILTTPQDQLTNTKTPKGKRKGIAPETVARMEQETVALERDLKAIEAGYGENVLNLTLARAYIRKLLNNPAVAKFMSTHHGDILAEFKALAETESL